MDENVWLRVRVVVEDALDRPAAEREAFVQSVCDDVLVSTEAIRLLRALEASEESGFLEGTAANFARPLLDTLPADDEDDAALVERLHSALADRYEIGEQIGRGGAATVYRARDLRHERDVALKVLNRGIRALVRAERFLVEIRLTARLAHPYILPLFDSGELDGLLFYTMPHVAGQSLRDRLNEGGSVDTGEAVTIIRDMLQGLAYAHALGIVHCDIKPENILLLDRHAVIADFGIARAISNAGLAQTTGTPAYMAPEQRSGGDIDGRADLYAAGLIGRELLRAGAQPPPAGYIELFDRMSAPDPNDRPASSGEALAMLDGRAAPERPRAARRRRIAAVLLIALLATGIRRDPAESAEPPVTTNSTAYELYQKARYVSGTRFGGEGLLQAARHYEQSVAHDSSFAQAWAALSNTHTRIGALGYGPPIEHFERASTALAKARQLDSTLAEAHLARAHLATVYSYDYKTAEDAARKSIALNPRSTDARLAYAIALHSQRRFREALQVLAAALENDPLSPAVAAVLGRVFVSMAQPDSALATLRGALELNPRLDVAHQQLGFAYLQKGMRAEAIVSLQTAAALSGARDSAQLAYVYAVAGQPQEARRIVAKLLAEPTRSYVLPFHIAMAYVGLGQNDIALMWLERGARERTSFMNGAAATSAFAPLHGDPRWGRLMRQLGLR